ncbi:bactofilin family protein [Parahaliea maris]|uniref:bactofilin family protein n=1 Tax=Parahaliea maris TaxID=2716870 RepID=UPI001F31722D|nr:polymer-forming cytoskeletal protein [Parahaliea maris]
MSRDTAIVGDIEFSGTLDIEGLVRGNILARQDSDALVRVVDKGCVEGEIRAPAVVINGEVRGNVFAQRHLELAPRAQVSGDVFYTVMEMAAGCEVNGRLVHAGTLAEHEDGASAGSEREGGDTGLFPGAVLASSGDTLQR